MGPQRTGQRPMQRRKRILITHIRAVFPIHPRFLMEQQKRLNAQELRQMQTSLERSSQVRQVIQDLYGQHPDRMRLLSRKATMQERKESANSRERSKQRRQRRQLKKKGQETLSRALPTLQRRVSPLSSTGVIQDLNLQPTSRKNRHLLMAE